MTHALDPLSPGQRQVVELIAAGYTDKDIMAKLEISFNALRRRREKIARRLNLDPSKNLRVQITWIVAGSRCDSGLRGW